MVPGRALSLPAAAISSVPCARAVVPALVNDCSGVLTTVKDMETICTPCASAHWMPARMVDVVP